MSSHCWTSRCVFIANFWISSLRRSCFVGVDVSCSGFMEAWSMRSLGPPPHGQFLKRFATQGYLCVSHRCCLAHQLGKCDLWQSSLVQILEAVSTLSRFLEAVSTSAERNFLHNRTPILARSGQRVCGPVRKSLHIMQSMEGLHVMRMMGSHICTHRLPGSSGKCPTVHEVWKWLPMEGYSYTDMLLKLMSLHPNK